MKHVKLICSMGTAGLIALLLSAQQQDAIEFENHSECSFFGGEREEYARESRDRYWRSRLTEDVTRMTPTSLTPGGSSTQDLLNLASGNPIDVEIFSELQKRNIPPAEKSNDFEFARRVTLDLTGRIPTYEALIQFTGSQNPNKRAELINQLLNTPEWVDKWTMYFGDLYRNSRNSDVTPRFDAGRNAFFSWIKASLEANKPYNQMATELIASRSQNTFEDGSGNWLIGSDTRGGPTQDDYDQMAVDVVSTFLGISHFNCVMCHNGRGHLDELSLWGKNARRSDAWGMSSFFARLVMQPIRPDPQADPVLRYFALHDNGRTDYMLNTTTGNRPARTPVDGLGTSVRPRYMFGGATPANGENSRDALARAVTSDFQFARATVNYVWGALMGRGLVEPLDQFDPDRLDPDNPPASGEWTLQPSNATLLNNLADQLRRNNFDLKWLMRTIATSETYQLSSRYAGSWNPLNEALFARKLVRRLMAEEIHDAIATSSGILPAYAYAEPIAPLYAPRTSRPVRFAMQLPETGTLPDNGVVAAFLNSFGRGNRLDTERRADGSILQALNLMNDAFVMTRIRSSNTGGQQSLLNRHLNMADNQLVNQLYLTVLSRYPTEQETAVAVDTLRGTTGTTRLQRGEDLLWSLYNKVDFIYNY
ncbi:MAG: DUF1553 domain-containing protein [Acidobacteriota bacterium]